MQPIDIGNYPDRAGSAAIVNNNASGLIKGALLAAGLLAGGGGLTYAGLAALGLLKPHQTIIEKNPEPVEFDIVVETVPDQ